MDTTKTHEQIYIQTHQNSYPLGHYLNDATYDMPYEGEFEDLRMPGQNYIICNTSFTGATIDDAVTFNEEQLIKFDSFDDFVFYVKHQPRKGAVRFTRQRHDIAGMDPVAGINAVGGVALGCQERGHYYEIFYSNGSCIVKREMYRHTGEMYEETVADWLATDPRPVFPLYVEELVNPISLESVNFSREFGPKYNGQVFFKVTRTWKTLEPDDTDIDGEPYTPETPPWMKRLESLSVTHEAVEETVEYVYPDWRSGDAWTVQLIQQIKASDWLDSGTKSSLVRYIQSYFAQLYDQGMLSWSNVGTRVMRELGLGTREYDALRQQQQEERDRIEREYKGLKKLMALGTLNEALRHAAKKFTPYGTIGLGNKDYAADETDADNTGGGVFIENPEYDYIISMFAVPFVNSAGVAMEAQGSRQILKIDFSYNVKDFDFEAPAYYMNKVNDREVTIAGVTYGPKTVLIQDIGAEYKIDYNDDATVKWTYWTVRISLLIDNRTFNKDYANLGMHVIEEQEFIKKKDAMGFDDCIFTTYAYRLGAGPNKGMILSQDKYNELVSKGVNFEQKFGCTPARVTVFASNPMKTEYSPRLDSSYEGYGDDSSTLKLSENDPSKGYTTDQLIALGITRMEQPKDENGNPIASAAAVPVADLEAIKNGEYEIVKRRSLQKIYSLDGHYYTKGQLGMGRPGGEEEQITEPMFLTMDGMALSPFLPNSKQQPTYLRGCIYDAADFTPLGMPVVG